MTDLATHIEGLEQKPFHLTPGDDAAFESLASTIMTFQREANPVYRRLEGFTYLPVEAFKMTPIAAFDTARAERVFVSSGTGSQIRSRHYVRKVSLYEHSVLAGYDLAITQRFGWSDRDPVILAHLPAYAEESSLVYMVRTLINQRGAPGSGFFLDDREGLLSAIEGARERSQPILLFGAAFGLLDLLEEREWPLPPGSVVIETGGMKTHRREVKRSALHHVLRKGFAVPASHVVSEYGMCELMSQCYTDDKGIFRTPPWMRFKVLDPADGATPLPVGEEGVLALLDLANIYTVSAILTADRAREVDGGFTIHGRLSSSELRGCNFLIDGSPPGT